MESAAKSAANIEHAQVWYRKAAGGDPPQPDALFQMARIHHEVRHECPFPASTKLAKPTAIVTDAIEMYGCMRSVAFTFDWKHAGAE